MAKRWQRAEERAAKAFGVERNIREHWGIDGPDLKEHPHLGLEVKSRVKISTFLMNGLKQAKRYFPKKLSTLVVYEKGKHDGIVVMHLQEFITLLQTNGLDKPSDSESNSDLDAVLEITQDQNGKFKVSIKQ